MSTSPLPNWRDDWALFLDVDGTLLEIAATPTAVKVPSRAIEVITRLSSRLRGALAFVSGRTITDLDRLFAPLEMPAAGAHGAERRDALGTLHRRNDAAVLAPARMALASWSAEHAGTLLEDKGIALALHYRGAPQLEHAARRAAGAAVASLGPEFALQEGKLVLEIKAAAADKGRAIAAFMNEAPFEGRVPVFIGDDLTDEYGFAVVNDLGGHSVVVGAPRPTRAQSRLADSDAVLRWLETHARESAA